MTENYKVQYPSRRPIKHGYSLYMNLPVHFVKEYDIDQGDLLEVYLDKETKTLLIRKRQPWKEGE